MNRLHGPVALVLLTSLACAGLSDDGVPSLDCPEAHTVAPIADADPLTGWACVDAKGRREGPALYQREGKTVVQGAFARNQRVGEWSVLGQQVGTYAKGKPTGTWRFPSGDLEWDNGGFEGEHAWVEAGGQAVAASRWQVELLDAKLDRGTIALRTTIERACEDCVAQPQPCNYPGVDGPFAGVTLSLHRAGMQSPEDFEIYRRAYGTEGCTSAKQARSTLGQAKQALQQAGLDPTRRPDWLEPVQTETPNGVGSGGWSFPVEGHQVTLTQSERPGVDIELQHPGLAHRDWTYDSKNQRVFFFTLAVDGVPAHRFVFLTQPSGGGHLRPEGLIVQGDQAALVLTAEHTGMVGSAFQTHVSPVISLSQPTPWAW